MGTILIIVVLILDIIATAGRGSAGDSASC